MDFNSEVGGDLCLGAGAALSCKLTIRHSSSGTDQNQSSFAKKGNLIVLYSVLEALLAWIAIYLILSKREKQLFPKQVK